MVIELEHETEERLLERARDEGKRPEDLAAELLRAGLSPRLPADVITAKDGWMRDNRGNLLGFDGLSWREIAHLGHQR